MHLRLPYFFKHRRAADERAETLQRSNAQSHAGDVSATGGLSFSQCGEDRVAAFVLRMLGMSSPVTYADIGAANPSGHNNTYLFYIQGGTGVIVEADPSYAAAYEVVRPRDHVESVAIVPQRLNDGCATFFVARDPGWSSVSAEHAALAQTLGKGELNNRLSVPCMTANYLFEKYFVDKDIHLLSIDIEGVDLEVMQEIDFQRFRPWVVIVENDGGEPVHKAFMEVSQYFHYANTFVNSIYVDYKRFKSIRF